MNGQSQRLSESTAPEALLFDLDGTLYRGGSPVPGAGELVAELQRGGIPCWYVTNNSTRTPAEVSNHLRGMGIPADERTIVTSAMATADYIARQYPGAYTYVIGERGLREALNEAGCRPFGADESRLPGARNVVVQGLDRNLTYSALTEAVNLLLQGAAFIQTNPDRLLPTDKGTIPGAGSIGAALEAATGVIPVVVGKPSRILMDYALGLTGTSPGRTWVIGDNPYTDLAAARNAGCPSVLVLTGLCEPEDWREICRLAAVEPTEVCAGPKELAALFGIGLNGD